MADDVQVRRILVIDDNARYRAAAASYFQRVPGTALEVAEDYDSGRAALETRPTGAIIDCFLPKKAGSGDRTLAAKVLNELFPGYVPGPERIGADSLPLAQVYRSALQSGALMAAEEVLVRCAEEGILYDREKDAFFVRVRDPRQELEKAIAQDEANQPLGVLLGHAAADCGIPFVLVSSTHPRDRLTDPVSLYVRRLWEQELQTRSTTGDDTNARTVWNDFVDTYGSTLSDSLEFFWARAYFRLVGKIRGGQP